MSNEGVHTGVNTSHPKHQGDVNSHYPRKHSQGNQPTAAASSASYSSSASTSQAVAEAVAETVGKRGVLPSSRSASIPSDKPSPRSKLEVLLRLQGGLKSGAAAGSMAKKQQQQNVKDAQGNGNTAEGSSPSSIHAATNGDTPSPCRLFGASGSPSHPLFRKEGQSIASALGRRSLRQSRSRSYHSPRVSSSGGGVNAGGGAGGGSSVSHSFEGFESCPSSSGPECGRHSKVGGKGSAWQCGPLSGGGSSHGGGAADLPNCSALSVEPWLAAGVVEQGGRSFSKARGSGKRRSSGVGLGLPLGGSQTPGHSSSVKRRSESWHRRADSRMHEGEGSWMGGEDAQASSLAGRRPGGEVEELQRQSRGLSVRSSGDFAAILKKPNASQTTQRAAPNRRSMERPQSPSLSPSTLSATGTPYHRKPSSLILQQHHQNHSHLRSPDLSSAGPGSTQSLRTPSARPSLELHSHRSDGGASTASREGSLRLPSRDDAGVGSSSSASAAQGQRAERVQCNPQSWGGRGGAARSPTAAPGASHPSPFPINPPSTSGGPTLTTIFSGALWKAARGAREAAREGKGEQRSGRPDVPASATLESSPSSSNLLPPTPCDMPTATMGDHKGLGPNPMFSDDSARTEPLVLLRNEPERRPPSAPEPTRPGHEVLGMKQQQQQLSSPLSNASSSRARTSGSRSPPLGTQTARQRRREKAAAILMARRASDSPPATSNGHTHRPTCSDHSTPSTHGPAHNRMATAEVGHDDKGVGSIGLDCDNDDNSNAEQESTGTEGDAKRLDGGRSAKEAAGVRDSRQSVNLSLPSLSHVYSCVDVPDSMEAQVS
ncbi:hypothetical protein DUNSADRAFT_17462 [Dunaliella salina]|uniref:Uncharacterized protein n=1 Tax=Dunaliella salina TaxID=3046 RepID=A0ABQ7G1S5_DUNSA|nr:hypothetical protein DUNSADRAFT_17462 [Dunaliella salina]|eukprot:KAF5828543.1 hypothetical protein DUNSADRAFT_17462 [Dunaliella salina]